MQREDVEAIIAALGPIHGRLLIAGDEGLAESVMDAGVTLRALLAERDAARTLSDELDFLHHEGGDESIAREIERARNEAFAAGQEEMRERVVYSVKLMCGLLEGVGYTEFSARVRELTDCISSLPLREPGAT